MNTFVEYNANHFRIIYTQQYKFPSNSREIEKLIFCSVPCINHKLSFKSTILRSSSYQNYFSQITVALAKCINKIATLILRFHTFRTTGPIKVANNPNKIASFKLVSLYAFKPTAASYDAKGDLNSTNNRHLEFVIFRQCI